MNSSTDWKLQDIINGYIQAIEFTECGPDSEFSEDAIFSDELKDQAKQDCKEFYALSGILLSRAMENNPEYTWEGVGHDLWLTRNGHGAGFWDRGLGSFNGYDIGDSLTIACKTLGSKDAYEGGDGLIYLG